MSVIVSETESPFVSTENNGGANPALVTLHQLLASSDVQRAVEGALLGKTDSGYFRMLSRLFADAAGTAHEMEQLELDYDSELEAEAQVVGEAAVETPDVRAMQAVLTRTAEAAIQGEVLGLPGQLTPQCTNIKRIISGFPEYGVALDADQRAIVKQIVSDIMRSSGTATPFVAMLVVGHADRALRKPPAQRSAYELQISRERANGALAAVRDELVAQGGQSVIDVMQMRAVGVGATQLLMSHPKDEAERRINRRVEISLAQCLLPPPPPVDDTIEKRLDRLDELLKTRRVDPDTNGTRTTRARCLLAKLRDPLVIDVFVDGSIANETINGRTPKAEECLIFGRNAGWLGNYDGTKHPMTMTEFVKFLGTVRPIIMSPGFAPTQSDDKLLRILGQVVLNIDEGIEMVDGYLIRMSLMSDPLVQRLFRIDGFAGDVARKKLQHLYRDHLDDPQNIYSCWK